MRRRTKDVPAGDPWRTIARPALVIAAAAVVVSVVVVAVAWGKTDDAKGAAATATHAAVEAKAANELLIRQRTESRVQTCLKDQRFAKAHDALVERDKALVEAIATDAGRRPVSSGDQAAVDHQLAEYDKQLVPIPDCSPEGIAAFYAGEGSGGSLPPSTAPSIPVTTSTTAKPRRHVTTTTARPTTSTGRPSTTSTTFRSSPTTTATPCTGVTLPGGLPCL